MSTWQPAHAVDIVLRFDPDFGPAMKAGVEAAKGATLQPDQQCREACRSLARGVGVATHAYVWAAPNMPLTHVRLPVDVGSDGTLIALRLRLNTPMQSPIDYSNGQAIAGLLQSLVGLPPGALAGFEAIFPAPADEGQPGPLLTMLNPSTLPGQKLCQYCRNPMPDYEVQCRSCGARAQQ